MNTITLNESRLGRTIYFPIRGSNQYATQYRVRKPIRYPIVKKIRAYSAAATLFFSFSFISVTSLPAFVQANQAQVEIISPIPPEFMLAKGHTMPVDTIESIEPTLTPSPTEAVVRLPAETTTQKEIENYIGVIFGTVSDIAIAVSKAECNPANTQYPKCKNISDIEYSVGIFQINLKNKKHNVHYSRIPGETMEEKIAWLENPFNNTLYAYWLYSKSGFNPWSAFTNNSYQQYL